MAAAAGVGVGVAAVASEEGAEDAVDAAGAAGFAAENSCFAKYNDVISPYFEKSALNDSSLKSPGRFFTNTFVHLVSAAETRDLRVT